MTAEPVLASLERVTAERGLWSPYYSLI